MNGHFIVRACWFVINTLLILLIAAILYGVGWEYSTRSYLRGFADAIIPSTDGPEQKAEAILAWIAEGPARRTTTNPSALSLRDPADTLNFQQLLQVCGTATNAFVNLAQSSGMKSRRLLLLDQDRLTKHVVVEVFVDNRWILVDPAYHTVFRFPDGRLVTRFDMEDPNNFRAITHAIPNYPQNYTYESTAHVRLSRIPVIGRHLRSIFNTIWPSWEESLNWTLLVERDSFAMLCISVALFLLALAVRYLFGWYCTRRLGLRNVRLRDQIARAGSALLTKIE